MGINSDHIIGFLLGLGGAALGHHFYKKNKATVDAFLKEFTPPKPVEPAPAEAFTSLSMEELMLMKERLEDMIAEREAAEEETTEEVEEEKPAKRGSAKTKK